MLTNLAHLLGWIALVPFLALVVTLIGAAIFRIFINPIMQREMRNSNRPHIIPRKYDRIATVLSPIFWPNEMYRYLTHKSRVEAADWADDDWDDI